MGSFSTGNVFLLPGKYAYDLSYEHCFGDLNACDGALSHFCIILGFKTDLSSSEHLS